MSKNIIICSDGTSNTFDADQTNVTRLIQHLALGNHREQVAVYDQGVGTNADRVSEVESFRAGLEGDAALHILPPPLRSRWPKSSLDRWRGLAFGDGLEQNIREMYGELSRLYEGPDDKVFLFGFSRGAFTVRALAGLLYRCRLSPRADRNPDARFERAWALYEPMRPDDDQKLIADLAEFRKDQRLCGIHFMGLWDTVKSYGGLKPKLLPHLRHNPIVCHVRHALALHEERAWFKPTTWGLLNSDAGPDKATSRLPEVEWPHYQKQDIAEVWFAGCHSDVGGGKKERDSATVALRWMIGEAVNVSPGLILNDSGRRLLATPDPLELPRVHRSQRPWWWLLEQVSRTEIDNDRRWPGTFPARGSDGMRHPERSRRGGPVLDSSMTSLGNGKMGVQLKPGGTVSVHATAKGMHTLQEGIELCETLPYPVQGRG